MLCPNCHYLNPAGANFCNRCGTRLAAPAEDERRLVSVLFVDIADFSSLAERLDLEQITQLTNDVFEELRDEVLTLNGTVDKYIGDAMLALFGTPKSHEDDPARALRCALAMMTRIARFNEVRQNELLAPIALHIGVETGVVVAEEPGLSRQGYSVTGEAVRLAQQLQKLSAHNEILVGETTYNLTAPLFDWTALGTLPIRSKQAEVPAYKLLREHEAGEGRGLRGLHTPLIGRNAELNTLVDALQQLASGEGGAVAVLGEVGLGKSRLVREAFAQAQQTANSPKRTGVLSLPKGGAIRAAEGRCLNYGVRPDYQPWQEAIRQLLAIQDRDSETALRQMRDALMPLGFAEDSATYSAIGRILGLVSEAGATDTETRTAEAAAACLALFTARSQQHPLTITLEDLHWADSASLDLLRQMQPQFVGLPVLFILVSRPVGASAELIHQLLAQGGQIISLQPLTEDEVTFLVCNLLAIKGLPENISRLLKRAEGNPFFVEEIVRTLFERGIIVPQGDGWRIGDATTAEVPNTLQGIIGARIDMLPPGPRHTLRVASVLGRRFNLAELTAIDRPAAQHANLEALVERGLLFPVGDGEYSFHHVLTQEVAYSTLLLERRRRYHTAAAEYCATVPVPDPPHAIADLTSLLSAEYHYTMAGDYQAAYELINRTVDSESNMVLYNRLFFWGEMSTLVEMLNRLVTPNALSTLLPLTQAQVLGNLGLAYAYIGDAARAKHFADMVEGVIHVIETSKLGSVFNRLGVIYATLGDLKEAVKYYERSLHVAEQLRDEAAEARSLNNLSLAYLKLGKMRLAQEYGERSLQYHEDNGDLYAQGVGLNNLGVISAARGQLRKAIECYKKSLHIAEQMNDQQGQVSVLNDLGVTYLDLGEYEHALTSHEQALKIASDCSDTKGIMSAFSHLARDYSYATRFEDAIEYHRRAIAMIESVNDPLERGVVLYNHANTCQSLGDYAQALEHHKQALNYFVTAENLPYQISTMISLSADHIKYGDFNLALRYAEQSAELAQQIEAPLLLASAYHYVGLANQSLGNVDSAHIAYEQAVAIRTKYNDRRLAESKAALEHIEEQQANQLSS